VPAFLSSVAFYRIGLAVLLVVSVALRIPGLFQDLPPYTFCDEDIYAGEAFRMYQEGTWRTVEFRSGSFNTYPVLVIASVLPPLDQVGFLLLGRVFYAVVLNSASVLLIAATTKTLFGRRDVALVAAFGFLISPTALALSHYWYPDHYLVFFSALLLFFLARLVTGRRSWIEYVALGIAWALGLSVKYSFAFAAVAIAITLLIVWRQSEDAGGIRGFLRTAGRGGLIVVASTIIAVCVLNVGAFFEPREFAEDFLFNFQNYGREGASVWGITFYAFVLFVLTIGVAGLVGYVAGTARLLRSSWPKTALLLGFPLVLIGYLGLQGLVINRNVYIAFPFVLPVFALGVVTLLERIALLRRPLRILATVAMVAAVGWQGVLVGVAVAHDLAPDSRVLAERWIDENIPASATVGMNEFCSGVSPAYHHGNLALDADLDAGYDYYVIDTYWHSPLDGAYRGRSAIASTIDQEYLHFYYLDDRALPLYYLTQFFTPEVTAEELVPAGYEIVRTFSSSGPDIIVLRRVD
jgi:4-amino-4-deoxy-L-arabinose transferase-like glycosyltransferase